MGKSKKGFTLAELLIVVAIIAVLVAIAIPIFSTQLEKSREATDLANVRSAYAELMSAAITEDKDMLYKGNTVWQSDGVYKVSVDLKQKQDNWQTSGEMMIGGVSSTDAWRWRGYPVAGGSCDITYEAYTDRLVFNWTGSNIATNLTLNPGSWNAKGSHDADHYQDIISTANNGQSKYKGLYELDKNTTYRVSFTYDPHLDDSDHPTQGIIAKATLLFDSNGKNVLDTGTGNFIMNQETNLKGITYKYTTNRDGTVTYTATFTTGSGSDKYYYGMNFGGMKIKNPSTGEVDKSSHLKFTGELGMTDTEYNDFKYQVQNDFRLEKVK